jgi:hypothetical protein
LKVNSSIGNSAILTDGPTIRAIVDALRSGTAYKSELQLRAPVEVVPVLGD